MKVLTLNNPELLEILNEFSDFMKNYDHVSLETLIPKIEMFKDVAKKDKINEGTSLSYLNNALISPKEYGFPRLSWGLEINYSKNLIDEQLKNQSKITNDKLMNFFGARNNALIMYYPSNGYIGWHNNSNAHGYNIILTYSFEGDGNFSYLDIKTNEIIKLNDKQGWNAKAGYFGKFKESEKIVWHCAKTKSPRMTLSYVIFDKNIWENMIEDIESP